MYNDLVLSLKKRLVEGCIHSISVPVKNTFPDIYELLDNQPMMPSGCPVWFVRVILSSTPHLLRRPRPAQAMNETNGGEHLAGEFDLFWGMGPNRSNKSISTQHGSNSSNNSSSLRDASSGGGVGSIPSASLNPTRMGALWSHDSTLEAYGHRHHVHAQADGLMESVVGLASPPSSHRQQAWRPSYDPVKRSGGGDASVASPLQHVQPQRPHVSADAVSPPTALAAAKVSPYLDRNGSVESKLEELAAAITSSVLGKLDLGVRETIMAQQQVQQQQQGRQRDGVPSSYLSSSTSSSTSSTLCPAAPTPLGYVPHEDSQRRVAESVVAPLRTKLASLQDQVTELKAALERSTAAQAAGEAPRQQHHHYQQQHHQQQQQQQPQQQQQQQHPQQQPQQQQQQQQQGKRALRPEGIVGDNNGGDSRKGGWGGGSGGVGAGVPANTGAGGGGGGGGGTAGLEQTLAALAQRTGTLEGRHKQVQAKVALLDNAFGSKAADWAQTIKLIISERDAATATGRAAAAAAGAATPAARGRGGGAGATKGGKKPSVAADVIHSKPKQVRDGGDVFGGVGSGSGCMAVGTGAAASQQSREATPAAAGGASETSAAGSGSGNGGGSASQRVVREKPTASSLIDDQGDGNRACKEPVHGNRLPRLSPLPASATSPGEDERINANGGNGVGAAAAAAGPTPSQRDHDQVTHPPEPNENESRQNQAATAAAVAAVAVDPCAACAETKKRCGRLEARIAESEQALLRLRGEAASATASATAAVGAVEALEKAAAAAAAATAAAAEATAAESRRRDANALLTEAGRQHKAAAGGGGGGGNWASKGALEKLMIEVNRLSERTKDSEDSVALLDHGLKGIRDEVSGAALYGIVRRGVVRCWAVLRSY